MRWDFTHLARRTPTVWHLVVSLLLWEFTLLSTPAHATPTDLFGFGARSPALAMGGVASSENAEAAHLNPARLALLRRKSILIGASGGRYRVGIDGETTPIEAVRSTMIGFVLPLGFGDVLEKRLVIGGAFYTPLGALLRGDVRFAEVPHWAVINRAHSLGLSVAMGIDMSGLVDGLAIGGGVSALATLVGDLRVQLDETNTFQSVVETQLLASFSPIVGVSFEEPIWMREHPSAPSRFGFGVVYRHELRSDMDLKVVVSDLPVRVPVLNLAGTIQYDPPQVAIEGFARPWPWVRLSAQLHARFWSAYPGPARATSSNSLAPPRVGFSDTLSPRIAMEVMSDVKALHIVFRT
ncbi:MAG: hypothetical protein N2515_09075, partial [Deltaproteobacteria bacterium]|nr:hypothetical protein [Deltaproteobacteria bacterium]